jgi:hypothetical protein
MLRKITMIIKRPNDIQPSEITPRGIYESRRQFMKLAAGASVLGAAGPLTHAAPDARVRIRGRSGNEALARRSQKQGRRSPCGPDAKF